MEHFKVVPRNEDEPIRFNKKKKTGFTLIELLAVIIILGILMIIAIPSVTRYISDSRKSAYVDTAKQIIGSARNLVNSGDLGMYSTDTTYYIDQACIKTENKASSPYGEFVEDAAYVVVTYDGNGYTYYWTSIDDAGQGISKITRMDKLDPDLIESDLKTSDIKNSLGIDGRTRYMVINKSTNCKSTADMPVSGSINGETGEEYKPVDYPDGKDKSTVEIGDLVKIGTEEFYVIKRNENDLVLLAHYNLKVGNVYNSNFTFNREYSSSESGYGIQCTECIGALQSLTYFNGVIQFAAQGNNYWAGKVGTDYPGNYCTDRAHTNCAYVYDSHSNLKPYVDSYKSYLERFGVVVKEARLINKDEFVSFENVSFEKAHETTYWTGNASSDTNVWCIDANGNIGLNSYYIPNSIGIRPVIVI